MKDESLKITKSCGNVFADLGFPPEEAALLAMRAELFSYNYRTTMRLDSTISRKKLTAQSKFNA